MRAAWIWGAALLCYGAFAFWYDDWRGPLDAPEIERLLERARVQSQIEPERLETVRRFLEADDGREFFMLNLLRFQPDPVAMPGSGELAPARQVIEGYSKHFMRALFRRAGHPALFGRAAAGYLEQWGVEPNPGWDVGAVIRYRSRRDMMELATDPAFEPAHLFKQVSLVNTLAFPLAPGFVVLGPRIWVALGLALLAALGHLAMLGLRSRS